MGAQTHNQTNPPLPMETTKRASARTIFRRSIHTFLENYHYFTSYTALIALPFSASILVSQSYLSSHYSSLVHDRVEALFAAARFPSSQLFSILSLKLSQTVSSSLLTTPFALTFLLFVKASTLHTLHNHETRKSSWLSLYTPLLYTYLCNSLLIISANATAFTLLCFAFSLLQAPNRLLLLLLSSGGAVLYSIFLANALAISNLSLVLSAVDGRGGYEAILKACVLIRGRTSTALSLALPISLAMAGIEALFQFRVVRANHRGVFASAEPLLITYLYSIFVVLDTIVSYTFLSSCNRGSWTDQESTEFLCYEIDEEMGGDHMMKDASEPEELP